MVLSFEFFSHKKHPSLSGFVTQLAAQDISIVIIKCRQILISQYTAVIIAMNCTFNVEM